MALIFLRIVGLCLKDDVCDVVFEFYDCGQLPKVVTSSFITLAPKKDNSQSVADYCLISLIGSVHKIWSKLLILWLRRVISKVISSCQNAFLLGRYILDDVLVANEFVDYVDRHNKGYVLFKIDFEKAYDSISSDFLDYMMERLGFSMKWRSWVKAITCGSNNFVLVKDSPTIEFQSQKGLK